MAYSSALGKFQVAEATPRIIELMDEIQNPGARMELALALARIVGDEGNFIQLFRSAENDADTALSQAVAAFQKQLDASVAEGCHDLARECADSLARGETEKATEQLARLIRDLPKDHCCKACVTILDACEMKLASGVAERPEILILSLHTLQTSWRNA